MPFLRRRGVMASESDIRRHNTVTNRDGPSTTEQPPSEADPSPDHGHDEKPVDNSALHVPAPPDTPPRDSISSSSSVAASGDDPVDGQASLPVQEATSRPRFSMLRLRNASDSQLSAKAKQHAASERPPPLPQPPGIITTAPTLDLDPPQRKQSRLKLSGRFRRSGDEPRLEQHDGPNGRPKSGRETRNATGSLREPSGKQSITFAESKRPATSNSPSASGNDNFPPLPLPSNRQSESSRSDGSTGDSQPRRDLPSPAHVGHTPSAFSWLPRRRQKQPEPLFPTSHLPQAGKKSLGAESSASNSSLAAPDSFRGNGSPSKLGSHQTPTTSRPATGQANSTPGHSPAFALFTKSNASPATAMFRPSSRNSGNSSPTRALSRRMRGRSSTMSSTNRESPRESMDDHLAPPTTRTSTSTGRKSFGDLLGLSRLRQGSEPSGRGGSLTPATPGSNTSKNNSLQLPRESIVLPERREDENPAKYLARIEEVVSRSLMAIALSKGADTFSQAVLRSYMRSFSFFGDPMDMAIRKLLMEAELPKETQHIDRCLQAFANRYHECNPGIYATPDQAYFIAFSLLILHTDVFNKNNKHKMQKAEYLKNTRDEGIFDEILEVFYDNISYTPFIHVEDDFDHNGERMPHKTKKKSIFPNGSPDPAKRVTKEPIDPYTLIIDGRLDILRPNFKDVMHLDDHYSYVGTAKSLNLKELQKTFFKTGILQIVSARSRPDAFMYEKTATNPEDAHPGIVDIKITKVGLLWRKDAKKKKTRSPWQEWGAILTGAQLYFFRNVTWVKSLMHQYETHIKQGHDGIPIIFKPPLEHFKPDALMSTEGAVALLDSDYKKHKHAFTYVRHGGIEEVLLADNEEEMNDWLAKLNYAAAFRTLGVRMRGVVGSNYDGQVRRAIRRLDSETESIQTPTGEVTVTRSKIDHKMAQDILIARREIMIQKVAESDEKLDATSKQLDLHLRNCRHMQILAPIHPKTREHMLLSAAKLAAQLKWTRMEAWKLKCHRDILLLDLDEERIAMNLPADVDAQQGTTSEKPGSTRDVSYATTLQQSPRSISHGFLTRVSTTGKSDEDSPTTDIFQTAPTSATSANFHRQQNSWELPNLNFERLDLRKASVSSEMSSNPSNLSTPTKRLTASGSASEQPARIDRSEEVDADERNLLELSGLLDPDATPRPPEHQTSLAANTPKDTPSRQGRERGATVTNADRSDRKNIRHSLQRTLRESAGHLSHHRSYRKGKESSASASSAAAATSLGGASSETDATADYLGRSSGSFVVHGKKASVINFGSELQSISPDERMRKRQKSLQLIPTPRSSLRQDNNDGGDGQSTAAGAALDGASGDYRNHLRPERERRESAASASTATARSFRELHRKYSSAQQKIVAAGGASSLAVPPPGDDTDSDAALSFSEGRRSPLPPIEGEGEPDSSAAEGTGTHSSGSDDDDDDDDDDGASSGSEDQDDQHDTGDGKGEEQEAEEGLTPDPDNEKRRTKFFTPEPPASRDGKASPDKAAAERRRNLAEDDERLPSSPVQIVSA